MKSDMTFEIRTETLNLSVADGTTMPAYVARPADGTPRGGLLVLQEAFGVNAHIRDLTERFARAGYTAIAPALYHRTDAAFEGTYTNFSGVVSHFSALTDAGQTADMRAAYDWLTSAEGGNVSEVGSTGYCMGGRASFLADVELPLRASISYYGGSISPDPHSPPMFPDLLGRASELHAPILLFWGGQDDHIGADVVRTIGDALTKAKKSYTQVVFSQAGHGFFCDARDAYNSDAAVQSWALTLAFLAVHLGRNDRGEEDGQKPAP